MKKRKAENGIPPKCLDCGEKNATSNGKYKGERVYKKRCGSCRKENHRKKYGL